MCGHVELVVYLQFLFCLESIEISPIRKTIYNGQKSLGNGICDSCS